MTISKYLTWIFYSAWILLVVVPVVALAAWAFLGYQNYQFVFEPSLKAISSVLDSGRYQVVLRTIRIAATITAIELAIALPFSLWLARGVSSPLRKALVLAALTVPFFLSISSRTIVWRAVLGNGGPINAVLMHYGLTSEPLDWLLFSEFAVHLGLIGPSFPTMVFPIYLAATLIDDEILEAAADVGANPFQTFRHIILPLILPGILAGIIFTFVPLLGETVVTGLLGGGQVQLLGGSINSLVGVLNYPTAAALGLIVLVILIGMLALLAIANRSGTRLADVFERVSR